MFHFFEKLKRYKFVLWWRLLTGLIFSLILLRLAFFACEVTYREYLAKNVMKIEFEIDLCYRTYIEENYCLKIDELDHEEIRSNKTEFNGEFKNSIGCYTKDFRNKTVKQIINEFKSWNISNLLSVESDSSLINKTEIEYLLFDRRICVKHKFKVQNSAGRKRFLIRGIGKNQNPFNGYLTLARTYKKGGKYGSKKTHFIYRDCWIRNKTYECTETNKEITFFADFYSAKLKEYPYETDCVIREITQNNQTRRIIQNECYENCFKKETKNHFLTYRSTDNFTLNYSDASELKNLIYKCSHCSRLDCKIIALFIAGVVETKSSNHSQIIINLGSEDVRYESIPLFSISKLFWIISALISTFFGLNFYELFLKSSKLLDTSSAGTGWSSRIKIKTKTKKKIKKFFLNLNLTVIIAISLSLILEGVLFDFGKVSERVWMRKESIKERNVSISVCFNLCDILNEKLEKCNYEIMKTKTIEQLINMTWNEKKFKSIASMRNSAQVYPIRQASFQIQMFFREFKKCFLLFYETKKYWPHFPQQRYSRIGINIEKVNYAHFYIEDGYNYPKIGSRFYRKSSLHRIDFTLRKRSEGCIDYKNRQNSLMRKDDYIQKCIIDTAIKTSTDIPNYVNLKIVNGSLKFTHSYFSTKNNPKLLENCEKEFKTDECESIRTTSAYKFILENVDNISINLTPDINEHKSIDDESVFIVFNRILSFLIILIGFSIKDYFHIIISFYFISFFRFYDFRNVKRIFYLILSLLFALHFSFLFYHLISPMIPTSYFDLANKIELPVIRFCYETEIDLESKIYTFDKLEQETKKIYEILKEISIFDDDEHQTRGRLNPEQFKDTRKASTFINANDYQIKDKKNKFLFKLYHYYFDNLKCFNFAIQEIKEPRSLSIVFGKFHSIFSISFNLSEIKNKNKFIFINSPKSTDRDFDYNLPIDAVNYEYEVTDYDINFQDDFFYLKNFLSSIVNLISSSELVNNAGAYLAKLKKDFREEQYAATTYIPLKGDEINHIRNRQFNNYIQFRAIASDRNKYDFSRNYKSTVARRSSYVIRNDTNQNNLKLTCNLSLIKFKSKNRNKYRYLEFGFHLFILICSYFKVNFIDLPNYYNDAYPFIRIGIIYILYYIVSFIICMFDLVYRLIKFLNIIND